MRRPRSESLAMALWRCMMMLVILVVLIPATWLVIGASFLVQLPRLAWYAWDDWRYHHRRYPSCTYTLRQALCLQLSIWADREGLR